MQLRQTSLLGTIILAGILLGGCGAHSKAAHRSNSSTIQAAAKSTQASAKSQQRTNQYANWRRVKKVKLPILMYHSISTGNSLRVPAKEFRAQMAYLKQHHYDTLTTNQAVYALKHNRVPQKKIVWITLDDSYKDNMTRAWPILKNNGQHATINFITGFANKPNHLSLTDAQKMKASGNVDFQSHTVRHLDLNDLTYQVQLTELTSSKKWLDKNLHQRTRVICYPAGRADGETIKADKAAGYTCALSTAAGIATSSQNPYNLTRQRVVPGMTTSAFAALLQTN
ncbi:polysaccharide deacetylase family protein [Lactiplantibacillus garii]|uniref:Polysaccharide deacetylase family protein n=1 Tax=Lactiplantibacillus garii TaxID=2306423 RepID=A0A3R8J7M0_9LACO|nr:polysaccharide deacetylase family protein [Lactiplantibacillus garii]RRK10809.1 polysaccharide deacetylase family protein [Lactiplantibacillus garii]